MIYEEVISAQMQYASSSDVILLLALNVNDPKIIRNNTVSDTGHIVL
jgi:hypothetical protein